MSRIKNGDKVSSIISNCFTEALTSILDHFQKIAKIALHVLPDLALPVWEPPFRIASPRNFKPYTCILRVGNRKFRSRYIGEGYLCFLEPDKLFLFGQNAEPHDEPVEAGLPDVCLFPFE